MLKKLVFSVAIVFLIGCEENVVDPLPPRQKTQWKVFTYENTGGGLVSNRVNDIYIDAQDVKWLATDGGLSSFSKNSWKGYVKEITYTIYTSSGDSLTKAKINALVGTSDGSIWCCLDGGGVKRRVPKQDGSVRWFLYTRKDSALTHDVVLDVSVDSLGDVWFANSYGISRYSESLIFGDTTWVRYYPLDAGFSTNYFRSCAVNSVRGNVWFGTIYDEMLSFDRRSNWAVYRNPYGFSPVNCIALEDSNFVDEANFVWIGTDNGVLRFSPGANAYWVKYTKESTEDGLPSNYIRAILPQKYGPLWVATEGGLAQYKNRVWTVFTKNNSALPSNVVTSLALDRYDNLWIGTNKGLAVYNESGIAGMY